MLNGVDFILIGLAAMAAGAINALAGGGTLVTFPTLTAVGILPVAASVTNTVALCPGYLGATLAQWKDLKGQERRVWLLLPAGIIGGILGGFLLLNTGEKLFRQLIPFLILLASALLAVQEPLRAWLTRRSQQGGNETWTVVPVGLAAIYGGYFGAGLSVIVLAVLGLALEDNLTRLNALKQLLALAVNVAAAFFFLFSGRVEWPAATVMAVGAIIGGLLGGKMAGRINPLTLRRLVVTIGFIVALFYLVS